MASEIRLNLLQRNWIYSSSSECFEAALQDALAEISTCSTCARSGVVVAERDPIRFSAAFFAAMLKGVPVLLANPAWQAREWQQLYRWLPASVLFLGPRPSFQQPSVDPSAAKQLSAQLYIATGGSSGNLKFARFNWRQLVESCQSFFQLFGSSLTHTVCTLPLYHVSGLMQLIRAYYQQGTIEFAHFQHLQTIQQPYRLSLVPTQLQRILDQPALLKAVKQSAQIIFVGGAAVDPHFVQRIQEAALPVKLCYGMTETAAMIAVCCLLERNFELPEAAFERMPNVQVKIRPMPGQVAGVGQIRIASPGVFSGYHHTVDRSPEDFYDSDDFGSIDEHGRLHVLGRMDELVTTGGEKVNLLEVQRCLQQTGLVRAALVSAIPDAEWGQKLVALYTPKHPQVNTAALKDALADQLVAYKRPKIWIALPALPIDEKGKVQPSQLQAILERVALGKD